jgi:peptidoglycan/LPS O-acetylase OafA/YrhL
MSQRNAKTLIPVLNGFRAYAILAVVLFHILFFASPAFEYGHVAWMLLGGQLDTFFIVSAFGLFLPVVRRGDLGGVSNYARKRFARLVPSYWATLTLCLVLIAATGAAFPGPTEIVVQYSGLQAPARLVDASMPVGFGIDPPLWMISVLFGLYVLLGLLWKQYLRHPLIGLGLAAAVTIGWKLAAVHLIDAFAGVEGHTVSPQLMEVFVADQLPGWLFSFAMGMTCAWAYVRFAEPRPREQIRRLAIWCAPLALAGYVICAYLYADIAIDAGSVIGGGAARASVLASLALTISRAAVIGVVVLGPAAWGRPFASRAAHKVTRVSYGMYLSHYVVAIYVGQKLLGLPEDGTVGTIALWILVVIPPSVAFGYLTTRFIERPARAWASRKEKPSAPRREQGAHEPLAARS